MKTLFDPVKGKTTPVFFYYAVPSVLSMLAISCAVIVDGFFIGNYSGSNALAAVNLTVPVSTLLIGIALMLSVGGAARCGRFIGKGKIDSATSIFSQTVILLLLVSLGASFLSLIFTEQIVVLLGANDAIRPQTAEYLRIMMLFPSFQMGIVCLSCFLRVDGRPFFAAGMMIIGSLLNVFLDWVFIAKFGMGHRGAAFGTGISEVITVGLLSIPFFAGRTRFKFFWKIRNLTEGFRAASNGFSEFSNEVSAGLITLVFNWIIMKRLGESGVAAFSVINYIILCGLIINCGISDSIQPVVTKNFGARKDSRIRDILKVSSIAVLVIGILISTLLILGPGFLTDLFIKSEDQKTLALSIEFISKIWPVFLLSGMNILISSYLTAVNRAFHSTIVSLSRNLVLPVIFLLTLPLLTGYKGVLIVLPLSELVTFFIAAYFLRRNGPARLVHHSG